MMYFGEVAPEDQGLLVETLKDIFRGWSWPEVTANLKGLSYFENEDQKIPHAAVEFDKDLLGLRLKIKQALREKGLGIDEKFVGFRPHVTLGYIDPEEEFQGKCPEGSWKFDSIELWGFPKVHKFPLGTNMRVARAWLSRHT